MDFRADLHVHSTASDGVLSPAALVAAACRVQLGALALTDHDSMEGVATAQAAGAAWGLEVIPGVELSTEWAEEEVHVLGYYLAPEGRVGQVLARLREARTVRAREILDRLAHLGLRLNWEEVEAQAGRGALGRPHIARALAQAGYVGSPEEAFAKYLDRGKPAYVPRFKLTPGEAIALIQEGGGVAVLAHPGLLRREEDLSRILELDWQGIEVFYPEHSPEVTAKLLAMARARRLAVTGGSDFHGPGHTLAPLGACTVGVEELAELKRLRRF